MSENDLSGVMPPATAKTWQTLASVLPRELYLGGGTALAIHLRHRISQDLDFFFHNDAVDLTKLESDLALAGSFALTKRAPGTLNGLFGKTKVQFLHADQIRKQHLLEPTETVAGIQVAGIGDIFAMKLKVVSERGELRDYFDLMLIEQETGRSIEEGLGLYLARYGLPPEATELEGIVRALGYLEDVDEDKALPLSKAEITAFWKDRQRKLIPNLSQWT